MFYNKTLKGFKNVIFKSDFDNMVQHGGLCGLQMLDYDIMAIGLLWDIGSELLHCQ